MYRQVHRPLCFILLLITIEYPFALSLTVTTFNMLAPVHRSMPFTLGDQRPRESERDEWWGPRANDLATYIANELCTSDIILLQECWFQDDYIRIFDKHTSHLFTRLSERRPGRDDGMSVLINKKSNLTPLESRSILTGKQRIGQLVKCCDTSGRIIRIANTHLSFPGSSDTTLNERRQAMEAQIVARAMQKMCRGTNHPVLDIIGGDFNSNSCGLSSQRLEGFPFSFVNCVSACSMQSLVSGSGGRTELGVTHHTHRGENVCVDHVFMRVAGGIMDVPMIRGMGYLDAFGTRILGYHIGETNLHGWDIISDHRPVTVMLDWPERSNGGLILNEKEEISNIPLDPLEPPSWWEH